MNNKIDKIKKLMRGECVDISTRKVGAGWYRCNVDISYTGNEPVEIVQCTYAYDLYAMPSYMKLEAFKHKTAEDIAEEWEI